LIGLATKLERVVRDCSTGRDSIESLARQRTTVEMRGKEGLLMGIVNSAQLFGEMELFLTQGDARYNMESL
jgi:hypothetical protein